MQYYRKETILRLSFCRVIWFSDDERILQFWRHKCKVSMRMQPPLQVFLWDRNWHRQGLGTSDEQGIMGRRILLRKGSRGYEQLGPINVFKVAELIEFILGSYTRYLVYKRWLPRPLCKYTTYTYLVEISIAICTDLLRLSLICRSTGSMLWMSILVTTLKKTCTLH